MARLLQDDSGREPDPVGLPADPLGDCNGRLPARRPSWPWRRRLLLGAMALPPEPGGSACCYCHSIATAAERSATTRPKGLTVGSVAPKYSRMSASS